MQSTGTSEPNAIKYLETLVQQALARGKSALLALLALQNRASTADSLDNQNAPADVIIAAAEVTPRASGIFLVVAAWAGTLSAAGTVAIDVATAAGPVTAFSGGTVEQAGGGTPNKPAVRYAKGGAVTATATGGATTVGSSQVTLGAGGAAAVTTTAPAALATGTPQVAGLILVRETSGVNETLQALNLLLFELP
jgi:hypothetical protein